MKVLRVVVGLLGVVLLIGGGRAAVVLLAPVPDRRQLAEQAAFLEAAIRDGRAAEAQQLFPEGEVFLLVLSGLVTAADTTRTEAERSAIVELRLAELDQPAVVARFGNPGGVNHGVFFQGWRLLLEVEQARLGADVAADVRTRSRALLDAVAADPTGFAPSYPGSRWPADTIAALAAVARADALVGVPGARAELDGWLGRTRGVREANDGLYPHRVSENGATLEGPRGTSASLVALFLADIDPGHVGQHWDAFHAAFVTREVGLVGVREYPHGRAGEGDVDSGPLVAGVSLSASAVGLAAARRAGAVRLADSLDREAELFGVPWSWQGRRSYAGGLVPVGDAFVGWSRSVASASNPAGSDGPSAVLWPWAVVPLLVGAACLAPVRQRTAKRTK